MEKKPAHVTNTCEQCRNTFIVECWRAKTARFCSKPCADASRKKDESVLTHKTCGKCRRSLSVASFYWSSRKQKYHGYCKACRHDYHVENREQALSKQASRVTAQRRNDWAGYRYPFLKHSAKRRNIPFLISKEEFCAWYEAQLPHKCSYCELTLEQLRHIGVDMSVDRIDNAQGYVLHNITLACLCCNKIKLDVLTYEDMRIIGWVVRERLISNHNCNFAKGKYGGQCPHVKKRKLSAA